MTEQEKELDRKYRESNPVQYWFVYILALLFKYMPKEKEQPKAGRELE